MRSAIVLSLAAVLSACTPTYNWREVRPEGSGVVLMMPCKPDSHARRVRLAGGDDGVHVFHAGTATGSGGQVLSAGGRVLCVTALGESARLAQQRAYERLAHVTFDGAQWRRDIGHRAIRPR